MLSVDLYCRVDVHVYLTFHKEDRQEISRVMRKMIIAFLFNQREKEALLFTGYFAL